MTDALTTPTTTAVPRYDDLPELGSTGLRHAWDYFGRDDEVGTLGWISDDVTRAAATLVRSGRRVSLDLPLPVPDPPLFRRNPAEHTVYELDRNTWDDKLDDFQLQGSTQWDGLRHVRAREFGFYGGWQGPPDSDPERLGIDRWPTHGIVTRGVLVDLRTLCADPFSTYAISADELAAAVADQCGSLRRGDALCVRTGWVDSYLYLSPADRAALADRDARFETRKWVGLEASADMARYLWDSGVSALVIDNPGVEVAPANPAVGDLHRRLIPCLGYCLGELFAFDELGRACEELNQREFLFAAVPLRLPGGVGSPGNAVAVL